VRLFKSPYGRVLCVRKDRRQRLTHAFQAVGHGDQDQDVLAPARLEVREDLHPEFRDVGLLDPDAQDVA